MLDFLLAFVARGFLGPSLVVNYNSNCMYRIDANPAGNLASTQPQGIECSDLSLLPSALSYMISRWTHLSASFPLFKIQIQITTSSISLPPVFTST